MKSEMGFASWLVIYLEYTAFEKLSASLTAPRNIKRRQLELVIGIATGCGIDIVHRFLQRLYPHLLLLLCSCV